MEAAEESNTQQNFSIRCVASSQVFHVALTPFPGTSPAALQSGASPRVARYAHVGPPGPSRSRGAENVRMEPYPNSMRPTKKGSRILVTPIPFFGAGPSRLDASTVECRVLRCQMAVGSAQDVFYSHIRAHIPPAPTDRSPSDLWVECSWDVDGKPCGENIQADSYPRHCHNVHAGRGKFRCPGCLQEKSRADAFRRHMHSCRKKCYRCFLEFADVKEVRTHRKKCAEPMAILPKGWHNMPYTAWASKEAQAAIRTTETHKRAAPKGGTVHAPPTRRECDGHE